MRNPPAPITKDQMDRLWLDEFLVRGHCGNRGIIETSVHTHAGADCSGRFFCICPNGRAMKHQSIETIPVTAGSII